MPSFSYRQVIFKVEIIGSDIWRWIILPRRDGDLTLVGQFAGTREQAVSHCRAEIDGMIARQNPIFPARSDDPDPRG